MVKKTLILENIKLPGTNSITSGTKRDYARIKKEKTNMIIQELIKQNCVPVKPYKAIRVSYQFYEGENPRDPDNCLAGLKYVHDAFVSTGIVPDDNMYRIGLGSFSFTPGDEWKVVVTWTVETSVVGKSE
ncbi:MAG: hypothetical protein ACTSPB_06700 [Candidatus Thorarchaeota archaeon]